MANRPSEGSWATRQALDDPSRDNIAHYLRGTLPTCASCFSATAGIGRRSRSQPSGPHSRSPTGCFYHQPRDLPSLETLRRANVALIKPVDPTDPAVADIIADWKAKKGTVGVRIIMNDKVSTDPADPGVNRVLPAAAKHSLAVNLLCWGRLEQAGQLAARNPMELRRRSSPPDADSEVPKLCELPVQICAARQAGPRVRIRLPPGGSQVRTENRTTVTPLSPPGPWDLRPRSGIWTVGSGSLAGSRVRPLCTIYEEVFP